MTERFLARDRAVELYATIVKMTPGQTLSEEAIDKFAEVSIGREWDRATLEKRANLMTNLYAAYAQLLRETRHESS